MTDYTTKATNLFFTANLMPTAKLSLHGTVNFSLSEAALDEVQMPDSAALVDYGVPAGFVGAHDYDYSQMYTYSDFDYELFQGNIGFEYLLSPKLTFTADFDYADLTDNQGYVYGNESGSYYVIRSGFRIKL